MSQIMNMLMGNKARFFEVRGEQWGEDAHTIEYYVTGQTQITKALFRDKAALMAIFEGIADDYFSTPQGSDKKGEGSLSPEEIKKLEK